MPLTPDEQARLKYLEALFRASGRGVALADEVDALHRLRELPHHPDEVRRRLAADYAVLGAAEARVALWSLLLAAVAVRADVGEAAFIAVDESDLDDRRSLVFDRLLDAHGAAIDDDVVEDDEDVREALGNLDAGNRPVWGPFAVGPADGRDVRLDIDRILEGVEPLGVLQAHPAAWPVAEGEEVARVGYSWGLTGTRDWGAGAWFFAVDAAVADTEAALRAAVADYLGAPGANPNGYAFNWGDAIDEVPAAVWARHGLRPLDVPCTRWLELDHDEVVHSRPDP